MRLPCRCMPLRMAAVGRLLPLLLLPLAPVAVQVGAQGRQLQALHCQHQLAEPSEVLLLGLEVVVG